MGSVGGPKNNGKQGHPQLGVPGEDIFARNNNDFSKAMKIVNPNYKPYIELSSKGRKENEPYHKNCALCSVAGVLQLMGYDVEAMPKDTEWRGFDDVFNFDWKNHDNYVAPNNKVNYSGTNWRDSRANPNKCKARTIEQAVDKITTTMTNWGEHSFAIMNFQWKNGSSHAVVVYKEKYATTIMDFQDGSTYSGGQMAQLLRDAKPGSIGLYRMDNAKLRDNIIDLDKIVKRRS